MSSLSLPRINLKLNKMKKNLRNILALALGLMTTAVSYTHLRAHET